MSEQRWADEVRKYGSIRAASKMLGIPRSTLQYRLGREKEECKQELGGIVPDDFGIDKATITVEPDGTLGRQWLKVKYDPDVMREQMVAIREGFCSELPRIPGCSVLPTHDAPDLTSVFVITDFHLGMLAWGEETGADWDLKIAESLFIRYFQYGIENSPAADTAILANIGDMLHFSGMSPITNRSGHVLDSDTRYAKLVRTAIRINKIAVSMLLQKYKSVTILHAEGNHDDDASVWLRESFYSHYEDEPRVTVLRRPDPYYCIEFGDISLMFHHGHIRKTSNIEAVLVSKFRDVFGRTKKTYTHMGHFHNQLVLSANTMKIEQHPTLAASDAHASRGGWLSNMRESPIITYDRRYGEISRVTVPVEMLK